MNKFLTPRPAPEGRTNNFAEKRRAYIVHLDQLPDLSPEVDAVSYFTTSGELLMKLSSLQRDACERHGKLISEGSGPVIKASAESLVLLNEFYSQALIMRGSDTFLELEWQEDRSLLAIIKNPRVR
jgi:hypothetical protein